MIPSPVKACCSNAAEVNLQYHLKKVLEIFISCIKLTFKPNKTLPKQSRMLKSWSIIFFNFYL